MKAGSGFAEDPAADLTPGHLWAGRSPLRTVLGLAEPDPTTVAADAPLPDHVAAWLDGRGIGHPALAGPAGPRSSSVAGRQSPNEGGHAMTPDELFAIDTLLSEDEARDARRCT